MRIKKIQTYEQVQMTDMEGKKILTDGRGRLSNVFQEPLWSFEAHQSGVIMTPSNKNEEVSTQKIFVPFANIPYAIVETEHVDSESRTESGTSVRKRRRRKTEAKPVEEVQDEGGGKKVESAFERELGGRPQKQISTGVFEASDDLGF